MKTSISDIKTLREKTQASYAYCKEALLASDNMEQAERYIISKGLKMSDANTSENKNGIVKAYSHPGSRICSIVEVSCKTDFVSKTEDFKSFANEIAMQIAAMKPRYVSRDDIPFEIVAEEMGLRYQRLLGEGFGEEDSTKMAHAEMEQWYSEVCLLEQTYVRNNTKSIKDLFGELNAKVQESCRIERFDRWEIGVGDEKPECDEQSESDDRFFRAFAIPSVIIFLIMVIVFLYSICGGNI
jgi:elongation factor Ts